GVRPRRSLDLGGCGPVFAKPPRPTTVRARVQRPGTTLREEPTRRRSCVSPSRAGDWMDQAEVNDFDIDLASPRMLAAGSSALVLAAWALAGRVPRSAWPRPPAWPLVWAGAGIALAALGNQRPLVSVLGFTVSLGGLNQAALFFGIALVSLVAATVLVWTTPVSAIPPLLRRLTGWAAAVRLPLANC